MNKTLQITNNNIWISDEYATITETKWLDHPNENGFRAYRSQWQPDGNHTITIQIRTHGGIGQYGGGVKRNMIATASLTIQEIEAILTELKNPDRIQH